MSSLKTPETNHLHPVLQLTCNDTIAVSMHFRHTVVLKLKVMMQITACYTRNKVTMPIKHGSRISSRYNYWQHFYAVCEAQKVGRLLALSMAPVTTLLSGFGDTTCSVSDACITRTYPVLFCPLITQQPQSSFTHTFIKLLVFWFCFTLSLCFCFR